ncbi:MAG: mismatch repair protein MutS domain protein [Myxococcales bacterium]|nr:mismatch repair protein MutS domain protein [Myxococcales bacterium]
MVCMRSMDERAAHADEYRRRRDARRADVAAAERRSDALSWARVAAFALAGVAVWAAATHRAPGAIVAVPVAVFVLLIVIHDRADRARQRAQRAVDYWERGLERMEERWIGKGEAGARFFDDAHPYARDLDLFGKGSLFELLCTARTRSGEETLARWLLHPAGAAEVRARQAAVAELRGRLELREDLALSGEAVRAEVNPAGLSKWGAAPPVLSGRTPWLGVAVVTLASLVVFTGWLVLHWTWIPVAVVVALVAGLMRVYRSRVEMVHAGVDRPGRDLAVLSLVVALFEREKFTSERLQTLAARLLENGEPASRRIATLAKLIDWANAQRNQFFAPIGWLLLWPIHFAYAIERWRARSGADVGRWIEVVGEFEALASLAGYAYERPDEPMPEIVDESPRLLADAVGHPLIPRDRCVRNDVAFAGELRLLVVSGSNMSGKSTMLRTLGINVVLALAGAPVRATRMRLSPLQVGATLRIQDSLAEGASRFYAEITRLKQLVDLSRQTPPLLFLIDEILAGTNSHDRRIGAEAVVRGLVDHGAIGLVTTHDLALAEVASALGPRARNVHFEDRMVDGKLEFDYRMRDGVVQHSNAIALMRAVGLEI